jgi:ribosomal protein S18 acetylase RimI-like enzyme
MLSIQKVNLIDADALLTFSEQTFFEFFAHLNDAANMKAYADAVFTPQKIEAELSNPDSEFYFAMLDNQLAGYLKLNFNNAQTEFNDASAMEIERIYVSGMHHGKSIGKKLLNFAADLAIEKKLSYIWLGVWEHNQNALGFYKHSGFELFGSHPFYLGDDEQTDLLMKKML